MKRDNRQHNNGKNRGYYQGVYDKYMNSAKECNVSGDKVMAEYNMQCAEHYLRLINEKFPAEKKPEQKILPRDTDVCTIQSSSSVQNPEEVLTPTPEAKMDLVNEESQKTPDETVDIIKKKRRYYKKQNKTSETGEEDNTR